MKPRNFLLTSLALALSACAAVALAPEDKAGSLEVSLSGDPAWLLTPEGFQSEEDRANLVELQKALLKHKANPTKAFLGAFAQEIRQAGIFKSVVSEGGALKTGFFNSRPTYSDGDLSRSLPIHGEIWMAVQLKRGDAVVWSSMVYSGAEGAMSAGLDELSADPKKFEAFFADMGRRLGSAAARKMQGR